MPTKKPIFYFNNDKDNEIKAGGTLFYFYDKKQNTLKFLMIKCFEKYEDFGGKTEINDIDIISTICREVEEESNFIFKKDNLSKRIKGLKPLYTKNSKYLIYLCKLTDDEDYDTEIFGDKEIYENIPRTVEWISYKELCTSDFIKNKLHFR